jgi:uncharacterized membrane protein (UPF0127 family)
MSREDSGFMLRYWNSETPVSLAWSTLAFAILAWLHCAAADPLLTYPLTIAGHTLRVEVAHTDEARMRGLMFRRQLPESQGMIFVYADRTRQAMWMKNTYIPLSVAFLDEQGRILNIEDMAPHSEESHWSAGKAAYAIEMNRGWFSKRAIKAGIRVKGLERLPKPQ